MDGTLDTRLPSLTKGLFGRLRQGASTDWEAYIEHPFVRGIADGTLRPEHFRRFLVQDYLYLLQYARVCALAIHKSDSVADMRAASATVSGLLDTELSMHLDYCRGWGLDEAALQAEPASIELLAYTGFMLDRAQAGDLLDLLAVLAACLVGYAEVGIRLADDPATVHDGNPYRSWIEMYSGPKYLGLAEAGIVRLNEMAEARGGEARFATLLRDFRTTVRLEASFWSGAMAPDLSATTSPAKGLAR